MRTELHRVEMHSVKVAVWTGDLVNPPFQNHHRSVKENCLHFLILASNRIIGNYLPAEVERKVNSGLFKTDGCIENCLAPVRAW